MKIAFGALHWKPAEFWSATLSEFVAAHEGFAEANGAKPAIEPPSDDEIADLLAKYG